MSARNKIKVDEVTKVSDKFQSDDFAREVYGVSGLPVDALDMPTLLHSIYTAAARFTPFLISTPNLNYLAISKSDKNFRESLLLSDLCTADGMPVVWISRLLGLPINNRIAGSDIFEALKSAPNPPRRLKVFLFGGAHGAAAAACKKLNTESDGLFCSGWYDPGFGSIDEMSTDAILHIVNSSNADFLAVALGAKKGQAWLLKNHNRLRIPVRIHLGATINFQAGSLKRAPKSMQKLGLEWLWRIKEEPKLWRSRYRDDGIMLIRLLLTRIIPLAILERWYRLGQKWKGEHLRVTRQEDHKSVVLSLSGAAVHQNLNTAVPYFKDAVAAEKPIVIDLANARLIDARFIGLILMLNKQLKKQDQPLRFSGVSSRVARIFSLSGFEFLLSPIAK